MKKDNGIKTNKRNFHSQDILDSKKNNKQIINKLKKGTKESNQILSKTNNIFPQFKYNNLLTSHNNKNNNDELSLRYSNSIIKSQQNLNLNVSECDNTISSQSFFYNLNKNMNLTDYQLTFIDKRKKNINIPIIKLENKFDLYSDYVPYDRKKILEIRNKIHDYLTSEFHKEVNSKNNSINNVNNNNSNIVHTSKLINYINDSNNNRIDELSNIKTKEKKSNKNIFNQKTINQENNISKYHNKRNYNKVNNNDIMKRDSDLKKFLSYTNNISVPISIRTENINENNKSNINKNIFINNKINLNNNHSRNINYQNLKFNNKIKNNIKKKILSLNKVTDDNNKKKLLRKNDKSNENNKEKSKINNNPNRHLSVKRLSLRDNDNYIMNLNKKSHDYIEQKLKLIKAKICNTN